MRYILFGAGDIGLTALKILGNDNVECFADNYKHGGVISGKRIISFDEMVNVADKFTIIVTSNDYAEELENQLVSRGVSNYIVFNKRNTRELITVLPKYNYLYNTQYMNYTDILLNYQIYKYNKIVIYGVNEHINYLLLEIAILSDLKKVVGIVDCDNGAESVSGIPCLRLEDIKEDIDCLIINKRRNESDIREKIDNQDFDIVDIYDIDKFIHYNQHPELEMYKNIHKGKRAFIVGNGPSVTMEDLKVLHEHNEICFALNKIYKIYDRTEWRPNYVCMTDTRVINACENDLDKITDSAVVFMADRFFYSDVEKNDKVQYVHLKSEYYAPNLPGFSDDITKGVYLGYSVTYDLALQIAAYMGFSEIYLIGMDHNNVGAVTDAQNHFIPNYFSSEEVEIYKEVLPDFVGINLAYRKAKVYSEKHGFRIYNATRGGKLEIFERVEFDKLF